MKTIETLKNKITENRFLFGAALKAAGYMDHVILEYINNDAELLRLAVEIYDDHWNAFDVPAFEKSLKIGA